MHYVRLGSFVSRDGTNIAAGRLCREGEREEREGEQEEGLSRNHHSTPHHQGLQVGGRAAERPSRGWPTAPDMLLFVWDA